MEPELYLLYRKRDKANWTIISYKNTKEGADKEMEKIKYMDNQTWLTNRLIAKAPPPGMDVYVPDFKYQIRRVHSA